VEGQGPKSRKGTCPKGVRESIASCGSKKSEVRTEHSKRVTIEGREQRRRKEGEKREKGKEAQKVNGRENDDGLNAGGKRGKKG